MPYVGNKPEVGNFRKCEDLTWPTNPRESS